MEDEDWTGCGGELVVFEPWIGEICRHAGRENWRVEAGLLWCLELPEIIEILSDVKLRGAEVSVVV